MGTAITSSSGHSSVSDENLLDFYQERPPGLPANNLDENLLDFYQRRSPIYPAVNPNVETDLPVEEPSHYTDRPQIVSTEKKNIPKYEGFIKESESIEQWWKGEITEIEKDKGYFSAYLTDLNKNTCIAEFDIDKVFEGQEDIDLNLYPHATFAFYVVNKHGKGRPRTESGLEFSAPYIWKNKDNEVASTLLNKYFPEDE